MNFGKSLKWVNIAKHLLDRRTDDHRRSMLGHLLSSVDTRRAPTCGIRNLRGRG
jgi:hypothetical protein